MNDLEEKTVVEQNRWRSPTFIIGFIGAIVQGVCCIGIASGWLSDGVGAAITGAFAIVLGYCNGNNPSIKGQY